LRPLLAAFLDLEDVALGVAEIAPAAASLSVPFDLRDRLHTARDKMVARGFDVGDRIPDLVADPVVLGSPLRWTSSSTPDLPKSNWTQPGPAASSASPSTSR
jgi:hypothetical protein